MLNKYIINLKLILKMLSNKHMKNKKSWFSLIELLVVITVLIILGAIAYFSFHKYTTHTRDSVRITDIKTLKTSLELYHIQTWRFPKPDKSKNITFNFSTVVWEQWTVGQELISRLSRINKIPLDPKYGNEYTYSLTENWLEYQIWTIIELDSLVANQSFITNTYANTAPKTAPNTSAYIDWNYNEIALLFKMNWLYVMYAIPSIMLPDLNSNLELSEMLSSSVVIRWKKCLPHSYKPYSDTCLVNFAPKLLYIWSNLPMSEADITAIIEQLKDVYSDPIFSGKEIYSSIGKINTTNTWATSKLLVDILKEQVPKSVYEVWSTIVDMWIDNYIAEYWTWSVDLISWGAWTWFTSPETWITFLNININDEDAWVVNCSSCIDF